MIILVLITILAFNVDAKTCSSYNPSRNNMEKLRELSRAVNKEAAKQQESTKLGLK